MLVETRLGEMWCNGTQDRHVNRGHGPGDKGFGDGDQAEECRYRKIKGKS
jgi:hypothetical protein